MRQRDYTDDIRKFLPSHIPYFLKYSFICLFIFGCAGSWLLCGLSVVAAMGATLWLWGMDFSLHWLLLCHVGSRARGLQLSGSADSLVAVSRL